MRILGIETSCDETSAAVLEGSGDDVTQKSLVILSQDVHRIFGGVVPELASRAHVQAIGPVVEQALREADCRFEDLDGVAVTATPSRSSNRQSASLRACPTTEPMAWTWARLASSGTTPPKMRWTS